MNTENNFTYQLDALEFKFPARDNTQKEKNEFILGPLSFNIPTRKLTSILGRSGSGKTTLLSLIGLLREHNKGTININIQEQILDSKNLWTKGSQIESFRAHNIGFALQKGELLPHLSLYDNAALVPRFLRKSEEEIEEKLNHNFAKLYPHEKDQNQLEKVKNSKPSNVSQGQYQRGAIVRALANNPAIILADEPTGNLDQRTGEDAMQIFRQLMVENTKSKTQSVIVVTHDVLLAIDYADEIIVLKNGQKSAQLSKEGENWHSESGETFTPKALRSKIVNDYL